MAKLQVAEINPTTDEYNQNVSRVRSIYGVQGAARRLEALSFPPGAIVYALCYDAAVALPYARHTIHDPRCTWAEGRNQLAALAAREHPDFDYLILADDDVEFVAGSFAAFETWADERRPMLGIPSMPKARRFGGVDPGADRQAARIIDEQLVALHRDLVGVEGICPLVTRYDGVSWTTACLIFEYMALSRYRERCRQNNAIVVDNNGHTAETGGTLYKAGTGREAYEAFRGFLTEHGVDYDPALMPHLRHNRPGPVRFLRNLRRAMSRGAG